MRCWRIGIQKRLIYYLNGELEEGYIKRVEAHLLDCGYCRARLARLRGGERIAQQITHFQPERDSWYAIEAAIEAEPLKQPINPFSNYRTKLFARFFNLRAAAILLLVSSLLLGLLFISDKEFLRREAEKQIGGLNGIDLENFREVAVSKIELNTEPHIVTEGYVSEVRIDHEEGNLSFKLVEDLSHTQPFVICEVIKPSRLVPPPIGSRVRVYGVSRYDGKESHMWYEIHPVLNIEMVHR